MARLSFLIVVGLALSAGLAVAASLKAWKWALTGSLTFLLGVSALWFNERREKQALEAEVEQLRQLDVEKGATTQLLEADVERLRNENSQLQGQKSTAEKELRAAIQGLQSQCNVDADKDAAIQHLEADVERLRHDRCASEFGDAAEPAAGYSCYDVVAHFNLSSVIEKGTVDILRSATSVFDIQEPASVRIIVLLGLFDKGKTWLINTLFDLNLPSGKCHTTGGLCMVYIPDRKFLIMDTPGTQATVSYRTGASIEPIVNQQQTETFLFEMVSRIAHQLIFVVNDFTWLEQRTVLQLHNKYVQSGRQNQLIVVHNLRQTKTVEEARQLFKQQITANYDGEVSHLGELIFLSLVEPPIQHVGFAQERSHAGQFFNASNRKHILEDLERRNMVGSKVPVADLLRTHINELLPKFVYVESSSFSASTSVPEAQWEIPLPATDLEGEVAEGYNAAYMRLGRLKLPLQSEEHTLKMKVEGDIGEFGECVSQEIIFRLPDPNVYETRTEQEITRVVEFEAPGVRKDNFTIEEEGTGYRLIVDKEKLIDENRYVASKGYKLRQRHGQDSRLLYFDDGRWELSWDECSASNGLLRVVLKKSLSKRVYGGGADASVVTPAR